MAHCLRALLGRCRVEPSLLDFRATAKGTGDGAFLVFDGSQRLRERPVAGVAEKLVVGHGWPSYMTQ